MTGNVAEAGPAVRRPRGRHPPLGPEPFVVRLDRFQGPLDLLLHLIRSEDVDIFDIPIARITEQFQRAIETGLEQMELDRAGEFLELAATLLRIKVQLLLPRSGDLEWEEDPRAELVRRLLEYELFQEVAHVLAAAEAERRRHFAKGYVEPRPVPEMARADPEVGLAELLEIARSLPEPAPPLVPSTPTLLVTVEEKIAQLRAWIQRAERVAFRRLFSSWRARPHVVAALLACLELARQQVLRIEQTERFGSIWLFRGSEKERDEMEERTEEEAEEETEEETEETEDTR
ncbi:MAG: segregation and condensation protein A [Gemmatimonadota bacterium]